MLFWDTGAMIRSKVTERMFPFIRQGGTWFCSFCELRTVKPLSCENPRPDCLRKKINRQSARHIVCRTLEEEQVKMPMCSRASGCLPSWTSQKVSLITGDTLQDGRFLKPWIIQNKLMSVNQCEFQYYRRPMVSK